MKRSENIFLVLCAALLLAADLGCAETAIWSENFDTAGASSRWTVAGAWQIGTPTKGPSAHSGTKCASTQNYSYNQDGRLVCINYNGASTLVVPSADQFPRLRFWHWFNLANALGYVEISTNSGGSWIQISPTYIYSGTATSGGVWSRPYIDLSGFAGQSVQIAFHFTSGGCCGNSLGWYVDDVAVVTGQPIFNNPEGFESDYGTNDWAVDFGTWEIGKPNSGPGAAHGSNNCAATVLAGNYTNNVSSRLISPPFQVPSNSPALNFYHWYKFNNALGYVEISTDGGNSWNQISPTYQSSGSSWTKASLDLSAYAGQTVQAAFHFASGGTGTAAGWYVDDISLVAAPVLTVPPTQTIYAGQTTDFTISAAPFPTNDTPIFGLVSGPTNMDVSDLTNNGVLTWTPTLAQTPSTNIITVKVTDTNVQLSATASFIVQVLQPLVLTVPPTQTNYVGQELDVTISATNYVDPDDLLKFETNSPTPTNVLIDPYTGELTWTPTAAQKGSNTITVTVTDDDAQLSATTNFVVVVSTNIPPPTLNVPPTQKIYAGQTLTVTNTATSVFPNSTFTFALLSGPPGVILVPTNGVLTWAIPTVQLAASYPITVTVTDSVSRLIATKSFVVVVSTNPPPPTLIVPPTQTNYAGQTLIVTNYAYYTNSVLPSSAFTFTTNPPTPPGVILVTTNDVGVLTWAIPIAQPAGTYTNAITVTDSVSGFFATSNFLVQVLPPLPPTLIVPPMQLLYAGQMMDVTNHATSIYPSNTFTYAAASTFGPPYLDISDLPIDGVLKWTPAEAQAQQEYTIYVEVTDTYSSLSTISNFLVLVSITPSSGLTIPLMQNLKTGGFQFTLHTVPETTWQIDASTNLLNWQSVGNYTANSSGNLQFTDLLATNYLRRFYRAVLP